MADISRRQVSEGIGQFLESMIQQNLDGTMEIALPRTPIRIIEAGKLEMTFGVTER